LLSGLGLVGSAQTNTFPSTGNVGIGTTSPMAFGGTPTILNLHDSGASASDFSSFVASTASTAAMSPVGTLQFATTGTAGTEKRSGFISSVLTADSATSVSGEMRFFVTTTGTLERVMTLVAGNVGIGTANPTHKLSVNGSIRAKEVIVDTGWSDYVFAEDYRLAPLSEVETHIRAKKHLPGIPSAAEVAEGGVSIGDMQARLLAKIEELTLHQITQEKRLNDAPRSIGEGERRPPPTLTVFSPPFSRL
jgi:hypothetical protein